MNATPTVINNMMWGSMSSKIWNEIHIYWKEKKDFWSYEYYEKKINSEDLIRNKTYLLNFTTKIQMRRCTYFSMFLIELWILSWHIAVFIPSACAQLPPLFLIQIFLRFYYIGWCIILQNYLNSKSIFYAHFIILLPYQLLKISLTFHCQINY